MRRYLVAVLAASLCVAAHGEPRSKPWEPIAGSDKVRVFTTDYIPYATFYFAYAAADRPDEIFVTTGDNTGLFKPQERWTPPGKPLATYAFVLDKRSGSVNLLPFEEFRTLRTVSEEFDRPRTETYPDLSTGGTIVDRPNMVSIRQGERQTVAAVSFDAEVEERTTFGLPSLIPFMGRQQFFEKDTFYTGFVYLDVFREGSFDSPQVRLKKRIDDYKSYPGFNDLAIWVQGSAEPCLVLIDKSPGYGDPDLLVLVEP